MVNKQIEKQKKKVTTEHKRSVERPLSYSEVFGVTRINDKFRPRYSAGVY